ncbi:23S rRNA (uracil1939-C5)-methyltransferase [Terrimicrobium sacchariphilum]|uniref:23S rRNA (Uracil1939-C5)-methyltransferase n=1 Tax=Terrimicrobium sacchariphilum TaxID=690879 RepID=A0A146G8W6_TERSA|nr:TRAM domain-containing protein [Terrimicrobium sacchariphilum]GAT33950.1 23S rRNA (uracil1939-C5)-methyltransferase [Terrimicrobium sacchariphilum]
MSHSRVLDTSLVIEQVTFGGKGLGRLPNGKVCFVPRVIPGERVECRIIREKSKHAEADLVRVLEASMDRVRPKCPVYGTCGGCSYQHIGYERQLAIKTQQVEDALRRLGGIPTPVVHPAIPSPQQYGYRNRISVHVRAGKVGFFGAKSHRVVDVAECPIASELVNSELKALRESQPRDGEYSLREPSDYRGFRQVNSAAGALLQEAVSSLSAPGGELLVDAYCGAGFFAHHLREQYAQVVGIEWSEDAVRAARDRRGANEIYLLGDVAQHLAAALGSGPAEKTTVLIDPPSEGIDSEVIGHLLSREPERIIYVSCNPATLARDIKMLATKYAFREAKPVDMFPQTAEIEVAALLHRL